MKRAVISKDRVMIEINLELKNNKSVGLDFVSGGSLDYLATTNKGLRISVKSARSANPDILIKILRTTLSDIMSEKPTIMPPTHLTGIIMAETNELQTGLSEEEILEGLAQAYEQSTICTSTSSKVKEVFTKSKTNTLKVLVIPEELYNELEKERLDSQDRDEKEYDVTTFLRKLLKEHKK